MRNISPVLLLILSLFSASLSAQTYPAQIGVGLDGIGGRALEFPNVALTATAWQSVANSGANATTDAEGWPTEDFRVVFFDQRPFNAWNNAPDDPQHYVVDQSGTYTLSFNGQATLTSWSDAPISFQNQQYDPATNATTLDIIFPPGGGSNAGTIGNYGFLMVNFLQTDFGNGEKGVKNIRLMRPGYQHNTPQLFRTEYLNAISPFSTIRFMDYLHTNNSNVAYPGKQTWTMRQHTDAPRFTKGAPWELIIALGNYTGRDIWINIPVDADSMYVVELARLMKATLRPDINIYLEYSNEVWNGSFSQFQYNYDAVLQSSEDADIRASTQWDDRRRARRVAKQVIKFGKIFEEVMGVTVASRTKIRPVFAWQIGGWLPWYEDVLTWITNTYGPPKDFIYGIASAPYFNDNGAASNATPLQVVAAMSANSDNNVANIQTLAQFADQWQIKHLQYEGGPDNGGGSTTNLANRINANRLPEMKDAVIHNYRDNWFSANANGTAPVGTNDLVCYFVMSGGVSRYGCWGATEDLQYLQNLSKAPKYDALCVLSGMCGNEPTVSLTAPANNALAPLGIGLNISANASDPDGSIAKMEFFVNDTLIGSDNTPPYSAVWTPTVIETVVVLAKAIDNDGKFRFTDAHVVETEPNMSGTQQLENQIDCKVFPNPAQDQIHIVWSAPDSPHGSIEVVDILGKKVMINSPVRSPAILDVNSLMDGVYFVNLYLDNRLSVVQRIVVSR